MYKLLLSISLCLLLQAMVIPAHGEVQSAKALEIQAAFLVKFSSYVKWPNSAFSTPEAPIVIGIFGRDPFGSIIDKIARSYATNGRRVEIRRCSDPVSLCNSHIVFVAPTATAQMKEIMAALSGRPVLLVGNSPRFLSRAGMINFVMVGEKIRFDISKTNSQKAGLEISSKLFKVARAIK
jgi:hypothetical protein